MLDLLLERAFEQKRWEIALEKAVSIKDMDKADMRQLCDPIVRAELYLKIKNGNYQIFPPHQAQIPKDNGEFRTVYVNENVDRVLLSIVNDLLFELLPDFIHPQCKSYQHGIGCGKVVQEAVKTIGKIERENIGLKADLSKYFDSVSIEKIDEVFDMIENKIGKSALLDVVKKYYHQDLCFDVDGNLIKHYQSLKQGCAVASFLADVMLYEMDNTFSNRARENGGFYCRYSDDILYISDDYEYVYDDMKMILADYGLTLNPKKVEILRKDKWFKFLGFSIKDDMISLSPNRIKNFQIELSKKAIKKKKPKTMKQAVDLVNDYLYGKNSKYSWATGVLPIINCEDDINTLNIYAMDVIRAAVTGRSFIGGLGYDNKENGCISRGTGGNVKSNRERTEKKLEGYLSLNAARNALLTSKSVYETLIRNL